MVSYFPIVTGSLTVLGNISVSGSITTSGSITISGSITSASFATSASNATNAISASYANNLTVAGTLTATTLVVQTVTSSVDYVTGSTRFGSLSSNTMQVTGSIYTSGSIGINTNSPGMPLELYVADGNGIRLKNSGSADKRWDLTVSGNNFVINETGVSGRFFISSSGAIGIGTSSPIYKLHVSNNTNGFISRFTGGTSSDINVGIFGSTAGAFGSIGTESNHSFNIFTNGVDRISIDSSGCVNVGGSGGYGKLDVCGQTSGVAANICRIGNVSGVNNGLLISKDASNYYTYNFGSGIQIGSQVSTTSGYVNETQTITALGASYFLLKSTGTSNGSSSTTFNLTGLPATDGTVIDVVLIVQKDATAGSINTSGIFNINGTDPGISTVFASGTAAVTTIKTFRVGRFNGTWRIVGSIGTY